MKTTINNSPQSKLSLAISIGILLTGTGLTIEDAQANVLEEIIVTAQKREQGMQDVGISVSAFSGDQLNALGVSNTIDITQQVPGFNVNTVGPSITIFNLRGISQNSFADNLEAPIATYLDDAYIASTNAIGGQLFDTERVEVLRGPQGTLFGRNATGGLVHFISKKPTEETEGYVELSASDYDLYSAEGAISGTISDSVLGRLSARWEDGGNYLENQSPVGRDAGGNNGYALKGQLQIDLNDDLDIWLKATYSKDDDVPTGEYKYAAATADPTTGLAITQRISDPFEINSEDDGFLDRDIWSATAKLTWSLSDSIELVSITNYMSLDKQYFEDADGRPEQILRVHLNSDHKQFSQELRLSGQDENTRWQTGLYYLSFEQDNDVIFDSGGAPAPFFQDHQIDARNWSIFGQYEIDLSEELTLIAGARWSQDDKDLDYAGFRNWGPPVGSPFQANSTTDSIDYGDWAARVQLDWRPNEDTLTFFAWNRGIKGGNWALPGVFLDAINFDPSIGTVGEILPGSLQHDEEILNSFEVGTKTSFLDGAARLNTTAFYYDYEGYQSFSATNFVQTLVNRDATVAGGELELVLLPAEGWDVMLGVSVNDSTVEDVPTNLSGVSQDAELPLAPGVSVNGLVRYEWDAFGGVMSTQFDFNYNGEQYLESTNPESSLESAHFIGNGNISFGDTEGKWKVTAWVKNITNTAYRVYSLDLVGANSGGFTDSVFAQPRWYGVTFRYNFEG